MASSSHIYSPNQTENGIIHGLLLDNDDNHDYNAALNNSMDSPMSLYGKEQYEELYLAQFVIGQVLLPIVCIFGIVGIILTVVVLAQKKMQTSTNCYLTALAIADLLFLLLLSTTVWMDKFPQDSTHSYIYEIYLWYANIFIKTFLLASIWVTVLLAVERYLAICFPMRATNTCQVSRARIICVVIYLGAFCCRLSYFWEKSVQTLLDTYQNVTIFYLKTEELHLDNHYTNIYTWTVDACLTAIIPFLLLLFLNGCLIRQVRKSTKYLSTSLMHGSEVRSEVSREQLQITMMLISIVIVFFVCASPHVIYTVIFSLHPDDVPLEYFSPTFFIIPLVLRLLIAIKSAVNFILYCWFSEKFRSTLYGLFPCCPCVQNRQYQQANNSFTNMTFGRNSRRKSSLLTRETLM